MQRFFLIFISLAVCGSVNAQRYVRQFGTLANLLAANPNDTSTNAIIAGRSVAGDGGGGVFYYNAGSSAVTNLGTVFKPTSYNGRWLRQWQGQADVKWFGATGDGTTDDTAAINVAITNAATVYVPAGTYMVDEISVGNNSTLLGAGWTSVIKKRTNSNSYAVSSSTATTSTNARIANLQIDGNKSAFTHSPAGGGGIGLAGLNITIENCYVHDTVDAGINIGNREAWTKGGSYRIVNNYVYNCSKAGTNYGGIAVTGGNQITITGNQVECDDAGTMYGIDIEPNAKDSNTTSQVIISANIIRGGNLMVDGGNFPINLPLPNVIVSGNIVDARGKALTGADNDVAGWFRNLSNVVMTGNEFIGHNTAATPRRCAHFAYVTDLLFNGNNCKAIPNATTETFVYFDSTYPNTNVTVLNNHVVSVGGTSDYGIYAFTGAAVNAKYMGNHYFGFTTDSYPNDWEADNAAALAALYATTNFAGLVKIGSQTAGSGLIVGSQTAGQTGFGNQVGIEAYTSSTTEGIPIIALNTATNGTAYIESLYVLWNESNTGVRAGKLKFWKESTWAAGDEDTYFTIDLAANGSTSEKFRVDSTGKAYIGQAGGGALLYNSVVMKNSNNFLYSTATPALGASGTNIVIDYATSTMVLSTSTNMFLTSFANSAGATNSARCSLAILASGGDVSVYDATTGATSLKPLGGPVTWPVVVTNNTITLFAFQSVLTSNMVHILQSPAP